MAGRSSKTIGIRIALEGDQEIKRSLEALGTAAEKVFDNIRKASDASGSNLGSRFDASLDKFRASLEKLQAANQRVDAAWSNLERRANSFGQSLVTVAKRFAIVTGAATTVAGAFVLIGKTAIDAVDAAQRQAEALGLTTEQFSGLAAAASHAAISQEDFVAALSNLNKNVQNEADSIAEATAKLGKGLTDSLKQQEDFPVFKQLQEGALTTEQAFVKVIRGAADLKKVTSGKDAGAGPLSDAIKKLGLNLSQLVSKNPEEQLLAIADAFEKMGNSAERTQIALALFGRGGNRLIPFLAQGSAGIKALIKDSERLGVVFTKEDEALAQVGNFGLARFTLALKGARVQLGLLLSPVIGRVSNFIADFIANNIVVIQKFGVVIADFLNTAFSDLIFALSGRDQEVRFKWILDARDAILLFAQSVLFAVRVALPAFRALKVGADSIAKAFNFLFGTNISAGQIAGVLLALKLSGALTTLTRGFALARAALNLFLAKRVQLVAFFVTAYQAVKTFGLGLAVVFRGALASIATFIAANPLLVAIVALGAGLIFLATRQKLAEQAASAHAAALEDLNAAFLAAQAGAEGSLEIWRKKAAAHLADAQAALADAAAQLEVAKAFVQGGFAVADEQQKAILADREAAIEVQKKNLIEITEQVRQQNEALQGGATSMDNAKDSAADLVKQLQDALRGADGLGGVLGQIDKTSSSIEDHIRRVPKAIQTPASAAEVVTQLQKSQATIDQIQAKAAAAPAQIATSFAGVTAALVTPFTDAQNQINAILSDIIGAVQTTVGQITSAFSSIAGAQPVAGGDSGQGAAGVGGPLAGLLTGFQTAATQITTIFAAITEQINQFFAQATVQFATGGQALVDQLAALMSGAAGAISSSFGGIIGSFNSLIASILAAWGRMVASMGQTFFGLVSIVNSVASQIERILDRLLAQIRQVQSQAASAGSNTIKPLDNGFAPTPFAGGGSVFGPGTSTSDSILARLSRGEFVMNARAVKKYGLRFMAAINGMRLSPEIIPRFRDGGLASLISNSFPVPRFAKGGHVTTGAPHLQPVIFQLPGGGTITGFSASPAAVEELGRYSIRAKNTSGGRKPTSHLR